MLRNYFYLLFITGIIFAISSCTHKTKDISPDADQTTNQQSAIQHLSFSKPHKLNWNTLKTVRVTPVVKSLNLDNLPSLPYDSVEFKPFSKPMQESKFDINALPSKHLDIDKLPSKSLTCKTYVLNPPQVTKAGLPQLKDPANPFIYEFGAAQGIQGDIQSTIKDHNGYLWILTSENLYLYDGTNLARYLTLGEHDYFMMVDSQNRLWLSKFNEIVVLDIKHGAITFIDAIKDLDNSTIYAMYEDKPGHVWCTTFSGTVFIIDLKNKKARLLDKSQGMIEDQSIAITGDNYNRIWIPTAGGGIELIDTVKKTISYINSANSLASDTVTSIVTGKNGDVWFNHGRNAIIDIDPRRGIIKSMNTPRQRLSGGMLLNDNNGNIWVGTDIGVSVLDTARRTMKCFYTKTLAGSQTVSINQDKTGQVWISFPAGINIINHNPHIVEHIGSAPTTSLFEDDQGLLWQATPYDGLNIIDRKNKTYRHLSTGNGIESDSLESVRVIDGKVYICTLDGLDILDKTNNTLTSFGTKSGLSNPGVSTVSKDKAGRLWIGATGSVDIYDPANNTIKVIGKAEGLNDNNIIDITQDNYDRTWVSTFRGGVAVIDPQTGTIKFLNNVHALNSFPKSFARDSNGNVWISSEKGIFMVDVKNETLFPILNSYAVTNKVVTAISQQNGNIYAAGNDGVTEITPPPATTDFYKNVHISSLGIKRDFNSGYFQTDAVSHSGLYYWGDAGVTVFDLSTKKNTVPDIYISSITIKDTLKNFADRSKEDVPATDTLWKQDGTKYFTGDELYQKTDFLKNTISYDNVKGPHNLPVNLNLPHDLNYISFDYGSFGRAASDSTWYSYRLIGVENNWSAVTTATTSHTYYGLAPGKYTFEVSRFTENEWGKPATFSFVINPPWWQTWWAYIFDALLFAAVVWCLVYYRSKQLVKANRVLEHKVHVRTEEVLQQKEEIEAQRDNLEQAFKELKTTQAQLVQSEKMASLGELTAGIAHEIQNPLNFINNFSEVSIELSAEMKDELNSGNIADAIAIAGDIEENLKKVINHGQRADSIVKGMLQHSRSSSNTKEPTDINKLADEYLRLSYHGLRAKDKTFNAKMETHFDETLPLVNVVQQDIGRVLLNLFNNAFYAVSHRQKTGVAGYQPTIELTTSAKKDGIEIKVRDNGSGIPDNIKEKIMQPFFTTKPTGEGTGLGLSLSYDIVVKGHGGSITVNSKEGEFTEFVVTLPLN